MGAWSWSHWLIVLIIVMLIFGTKKLRNIGSDLGGAVRGFKESMREGQEEDIVSTQTTAEPEKLESSVSTAETNTTKQSEQA